jgi:hypothetical protein
MPPIKRKKSKDTSEDVLVPEVGPVTTAGASGEDYLSDAHDAVRLKDARDASDRKKSRRRGKSPGTANSTRKHHREDQMGGEQKIHRVRLVNVFLPGNNRGGSTYCTATASALAACSPVRLLSARRDSDTVI